jgi:fused signal recognition particle receptor
VVYDAIQAAYKRQAQVVFIDTAGRLHTKFNLMEELKKIRGVIQKNAPSACIHTVLVIDATTGQNGLIQAKNFSKSVDVSGVFLTKLDGTAKGGIVFAICNEINLPIQYIGTGENLNDMAPFDSKLFVGAIFS